MESVIKFFLVALFVVAMKFSERKCRILGVCYGVIFGAFHVLGKLILEEGTGNILWDWKIFFNAIIIVLGAAGIATLGYQLLAYFSRKQFTPMGNKKISYPVVYILLLICYIPCYIAYFPGCMSYDSWYITLEALGIIGFDNHHPFLHTYIWSIFAHMDEWFGVDQIGIILYTATQLSVMVAVYAYVLVWIFKRNLPGFAKLIAFAYYAFNPVFHIFTIILTKDVLFSGCFLLLGTVLADLFISIYSGEKAGNSLSGKAIHGQQVKLMMISLLCCLFRNNMIYVVIALVAVLFLGFQMPFSKGKGLLLSIVFYYLITGVIYPGLGVAKGSVKEMMSVPLSQIAAVYQKEGENLSKEEEELIFKYVPSVERYDRFFADNIKGDFNGYAFEENRREFFRLWGGLFQKYPGIYVEAFLALNLPYWYPEMASVREYIETDNYSQDYPVQRAGLLKGVYRWYEEVSENQAAWMHLPVFRQLYAIGMPVWILLFFVLCFVAWKRKAAVAALLPCLLLWMTYLLGPVSCFRYIEPLLLTYPLWLALGMERGLTIKNCSRNEESFENRIY